MKRSLSDQAVLNVVSYFKKEIARLDKAILDRDKKLKELREELSKLKMEYYNEVRR